MDKNTIQLTKLLGYPTSISKISIPKLPFRPNISSIPVSGKVLDKEDLEYLIRSSLDLWL